MNSLYIILAFFIVSLLLQVGIVYLASQVTKLPKRTWSRAAFVVLARTVGVALLFAAIMWLAPVESLPVFSFVLFASDVLLTAWLLRQLCGGRWGQAFGATGVNFAISCLVGIALVMVLRVFVTGYQATSSAMSPNLRGYHVVERLPNGDHLIGAANDPRDTRPIPPGEPSGAIVAETYEYQEVPRPVAYSHPPDRFICNKTKSPTRWDIAVFRHPERPELIYVMRVVGLPGERVQIRDGSLLVNGKAITASMRLGTIPYRTRGEVLTGEPEPELPEVVLGADEYWLLGDNTNRSADSRYFGPVSRDSIVGVADLIYWPPSRWRMDP